MFSVTPPEKVKHGTRAHFCFGNDCPIKNSTYQLDFGNRKLLSAYLINKRHKPPPPAQVVPLTNSTAESRNWISTTRGDIISFGDENRRNVYLQGKLALKQAKEIPNSGLGILKDNCPNPLTTRYESDFRLPLMPSSKTPLRLQQIRDAQKMQKSIAGEPLVSEARHAFQWPALHRLKQPIFFRRWKKGDERF